MVGTEHFGMDIVLVKPRSYDKGMPWGVCYLAVLAGHLLCMYTLCILSVPTISRITIAEWLGVRLTEYLGTVKRQDV